MKPVACPHPFPFRWHRSMRAVMLAEAIAGGTCAKCGQVRQLGCRYSACPLQQEHAA